MRNQAIQKWLEGVKNAAYDFRPVIYITDAIPTQNELLQAIKTLSRLSIYGGFITGVEELYTQEAKYAIEHFDAMQLTPSQCAAARDAITETLESYYHYDPAIGNGTYYQLKCFMRTMKEIDNVIAHAMLVHEPQIPSCTTKIIKCCTTPYYKHNEESQQQFKYHQKLSTLATDFPNVTLKELLHLLKEETPAKEPEAPVLD